jgi:tetraacyldisaccharide 4'-kinase
MSLLPDAESFKRVVDGSSRGLGPSAARLALAAASGPFALAVAIRGVAYDAGLLPVIRADVPVISVGNLTLGGTGKTPLVAWIVRLLRAAGHVPAVVSRGYGARPGEVSDEAAELAVVLPGVIHVADRDRATAARTAVAAGASAVVLDDGFQHRRLHRDLDIVAIDATDPFGCGRLFPRGLLREPLRGLARAGAIVLARAGSVTPQRRVEIRDTLERACGGRLPGPWMEAEHRPVALRSSGGLTQPLDALAGRRVVGFAGIGNPAAFRATLAAMGADVADFLPFPDHHAYAAHDLARIAARARAAGAAILVTTLKDLVKVRHDDLDGIPVAAVEIALDATTGGEGVAGAVVSAARPPLASRNRAS